MFVPSWERLGLGVKISPTRTVTHAIWSDNIYFVGKNLHEITIMIKSVTELFHHHGLSWKKKSVVWMEAGEIDKLVPLPEFPVPGQEDPSLTMRQVISMDSLGTKIFFDGSDEGAVTEAIRRADNAFWAHKDVFFGKYIAWQAKFRFFETHVIPVLLHSAAIWTWSKHLCSTLNGWENR